MDAKMTQLNNPLRQFFRQPAIYTRLPSDGKFWAEGSLDMPENHELPILPMTAVDEITYRTPDALFNGQAVISVVESCCPSIKNAWAMPSVDVDTILTAIRIASYGHELEIDTRCPHCGHQEEYALDLRRVLDGLRLPDYDKTINSGDLEIHFTPITYRQMHENNALQFDEQRIIQMLPEADMSETEKVAMLSSALKKVTELTIKTLTMTISMIKTPGTMVTDREHIADFLKNCDRSVFQQIRDHVVSLRQDSEVKPMTINCGECQKQFQQPFTLDQANFFAPAS
jgi:bacterioferritin-associated ferredoxin